ncbi:MAG: alpha/beta fold hydrolase [Alphaproteobacteria bacterium]|jgi:homoserine O-acetyltransferase|nr:alpha/beta fold hydrolase [Alphaproteobacteria bacterium]
MTEATAATFTAKSFALECGATLPEMTLAYETYGGLDDDKGNAILLLHGYTSSQHAAGTAQDPGWFDGLVGPGKTIDTDRYFVICPNNPGSCHGSTGPNRIDPATGGEYGPDFPDISCPDMAAAQKLMVEDFGIERLAAVIGYSYGGYLTYQWAVMYPDAMRALVPVATAIKGRGDPSMVQDLVDRFAAAPGWNGGRWYGNGEGILDALIEWRMTTLLSYNVDDELRAQDLDEAAVEAGVRERATDWARNFDPNSLVVLRRAAIRFDAEKDAGNIKAPVLYVLATTDKLFGPERGPATVEMLRGLGVEADYFELASDYGHRAPAVDWAKWAPALGAFLDAHCGVN